MTLPLPAPTRAAKSHQKRGHQQHRRTELFGIKLDRVISKLGKSTHSDTTSKKRTIYLQNSKQLSRYLQKKAAKEVATLESAVATIALASDLFPLETFPAIDIQHPDKTQLLETLRRITSHMRAQVYQYEQIYHHYITDIKDNFQAINHAAKEFQDVLDCVRKLPEKPTDPELVHNALRKVGAAAHRIIFLQKAEIESLKSQLAKALGVDLLIETAQKNDGEHIESLTKYELQSRRDEVRKMISSEYPLNGIPRYEGKNISGTAIEFFKKYYEKYIAHSNEVIFAADLAKIDDRLLRAIRNEARNGIPMPIGTISDLLNALETGRFIDGKDTQRRVYNARMQEKARKSTSAHA